MNDTDIINLLLLQVGQLNSTQNGNTDFADYYGASSETELPTSGSTINGQAQLQQISASSYISSGGTSVYHLICGYGQHNVSVAVCKKQKLVQ